MRLANPRVVAPPPRLVCCGIACTLLCTVIISRTLASSDQNGTRSSQEASAAKAVPATKVPSHDLAGPTELITAQRGTLPIVISAPHGGMVRVPGSQDRLKGVLVRDANTAEVALLVAQRLTHKLGGKPSFVIAQFSRRDADANRSPESGEAFETDAARAQYEAYHRTLRTLVREVRGAHAGAILIDIHAQVRARDAFVRGTRDGRSVQALLNRRGVTALTGPDSIFGRLQTQEYRVLPELPAADSKPASKDALTDPALNETMFDGGFITEHYGSHQVDGVDAIQIEIGGDLINNPTKTARDLADAIAHFAIHHLGVASPEPEPQRPTRKDRTIDSKTPEALPKPSGD